MIKASKLQKAKKFLVLSFSRPAIFRQAGSRLLFICLAGSFALCVLHFAPLYALNLDKLKINFLEGDYKSAILEGEKILAVSGNRADLDELYYILGLSYLKEGNYLRASDIFQIILEDFQNSKFKEEARLGLGDTYFLRGDLVQAELHYQELIKDNPLMKFKAPVYFRLSQIAFKKGNQQVGKEYIDKLKQESPLSLELRTDRDLFIAGVVSLDYYTVQVGAFSEIKNAGNLAAELAKNGYPTYIEELESDRGVIYKVRIGKFNRRQEAEDLEKRLIKEGYPTKIYP